MTDSPLEATIEVGAGLLRKRMVILPFDWGRLFYEATLWGFVGSWIVACLLIVPGTRLFIVGQLWAIVILFFLFLLYWLRERCSVVIEFSEKSGVVVRGLLFRRVIVGVGSLLLCRVFHVQYGQYCLVASWQGKEWVLAHRGEKVVKKFFADLDIIMRMEGNRGQ